jgi:hypothetical protein
MALMPNETKEQIKALWFEGKTSGQIAKALGITRNAVMGAVNRMRSKGEELPLRAPHLPNKKPKPARKRPEKPKLVLSEDDAQEPSFEFPDNYLTLMDLRMSSCRFIVAEGNVHQTRYCGQTIDRNSYCKAHYKLCYHPVYSSR